MFKCGLFVGANNPSPNLLRVNELSATEYFRLQAKVSALSREPKNTENAVDRRDEIIGELLGLLDPVVPEKCTAEPDDQIREFAELTSDWLWEMGPDLRFTYHSPRYFELFGYLPIDKIGHRPDHHAVAVEVGKNQEKWRLHFADLEAHREFRNFECRLVTRNGEIRHVRVSGVPKFDSAGNFNGYWGTGQDISKEYRALNAAAVAHDRLANALDAFPQAVVLYDQDDQIIFVNKYYRKNFALYSDEDPIGFTFEEAIRHRVIHGHVEEAAGQEEEWIRARVEQHQQHLSPLRMRRGGKNKIWLDHFDIASPDGGSLIFLVDVTQQHNLQLDLEAAKVRADVANESKSQFLATMSHELRTPLNAIIGFSDMIHQQMFGPIGHERYNKYVEGINQSGKDLLALIDDILDLSRIEAGRLELHESEFDPDQVVEECVRLIRGEAGENRVAIDISGSDIKLLLNADRRQLKQILLNLLSNAIKYTVPDSRIRVQTEQCEQGILRFSVSDCGNGITSAEIERITGTFNRLNDAFTTGGGGTGLGLTIAKRLIEAHGGELLIESTLDVGTTATVSFPSHRVIELGE